MTEDRQHLAQDRTAEVPGWGYNRERPRDPTSGFLKPCPCELYVAGHTPHVIQVRVCLGGEARAGKLRSVDGNVIAVEVGDHVEQFRNHEPERLLEIVGTGGTVQVFSSVLQGWTKHVWSIAPAKYP